jgi:hypothetical protein
MMATQCSFMMHPAILPVNVKLGGTSTIPVYYASMIAEGKTRPRWSRSAGLTIQVAALVLQEGHPSYECHSS